MPDAANLGASPRARIWRSVRTWATAWRTCGAPPPCWMPATGVRLLRSSRVYETDPVGPPQPDYLNVVVEAETTLRPRGLLDACLAVENEMGRVRGERWGPRVIDVDVLTYGDEEVDEPGSGGAASAHARAGVRARSPARTGRRPAAPRRAPGGVPSPGGGVLFGRPAVRPTARAPGASPAYTRPRPGTRQRNRNDRYPLEANDPPDHRGARRGGKGGHRARRAPRARRARRGRGQRSRGLPGARRRAPSGREVRAGRPKPPRPPDTILLGVPDDLHRDRLRPPWPPAGCCGPARRLVHLSGSVSLEALARRARVGRRRALDASAAVVPGRGDRHRTDAGQRRRGDRATTRRTPRSGRTWPATSGGRPFRISDTVKPLYHAAAVFSSNYLVVVEALAERLLAAAGVEEAAALLEPLARTSFDRTFSLGPTAALTGPASRGDAGTIRRNLEALAAGAPDAVPPYAALAAAAAGLAEEAGRLTREQRLALEEAIRPVEVIRDRASFRAACEEARSRGHDRGARPDDGCAARGARVLFERARREVGFVAVSIFVNPLQFGPGDDLERYPRRLESDLEIAENVGLRRRVHSERRRDVSARAPRDHRRPGAARRPPGGRRPGAGHFRGVLTVVAKLLHLAGPVPRVLRREGRPAARTDPADGGRPGHARRPS